MTDTENSLRNPTARERSQKRIRLEESDTAGTINSSEPVNEHEILWLEDGNVILIAGSTKFCVHRSVLSRNSTIFADMFSLPQPSQIGGGVSLPEVQLPDAVEDVEHMLKALYDRTYYVKGQPESFHKLAGLLRMGTKYEIQHLRADVLEHLSRIFPSKLQALLEIPDTKPLSFPSLGPDCQTIAVVYAVIALAREVRAEILLPSAFYKLQGYDATVCFDSGEVEGRPYRLSPEDIKACISGRDKFRIGFCNHALQILYKEEAIPGCRTRAQCQSFRRQSLSSPGMLAFAAQGVVFPRKLPSDAEHGFCAMCLKHYKRAKEEAYEAIWNELPGYFGLVGWPALISGSK